MAHSAGSTLRTSIPPMSFDWPWSGHLFVSNQFVSILNEDNFKNPTKLARKHVIFISQYNSLVLNLLNKKQLLVRPLKVTNTIYLNELFVYFLFRLVRNIWVNKMIETKLKNSPKRKNWMAKDWNDVGRRPHSASIRWSTEIRRLLLC